MLNKRIGREKSAQLWKRIRICVLNLSFVQWKDYSCQIEGAKMELFLSMKLFCQQIVATSEAIEYGEKNLIKLPAYFWLDLHF